MSPSTTEPTMFMPAEMRAPCSTRLQLWSIHVENVVYAPRKPMIKGGRISGDSTPRLLSPARTAGPG